MKPRHLLLTLLLLAFSVTAYTQDFEEKCITIEDSIVQSDVEYIIEQYENNVIVECSYFVYCDECNNTYFSYDKFPMWWVKEVQEELKEVKQFEGVPVEIYCPEDGHDTTGHLIYLHIVDDMPVYMGNRVDTFKEQ